MKFRFLTASALGCVISSVAALSAQANNATVENALRSRPELSTFYQEMAATGVAGELKAGQPYTVFAPTNNAFAKLALNHDCATTDTCRATMTQIIRNHIVEGEKHLHDIGDEKGGGILSMFSINDYHLTASQPQKDKFAVDGHDILSENQLLGGVLYTTDSVFASKQELAALIPVTETAGAMYVTKEGEPPHVPAGTIVTITDTKAVPVSGE